MYLQEDERYTPYVARILSIEDITRGDGKQYLVRYRGRLRIESVQAYDQLTNLLRPLDITPMFRNEQGCHAIYLVTGAVRLRPSRIWVNILLFLATVFSVLLTGTLYSMGGLDPQPSGSDIDVWLRAIAASLGGGLAFTASLLGILLAHEFGHYLAGRFHNTDVTLPYFLPFPFSIFGTLGAFIQLRETPRNRRILMDIGIAGPLAGLVVAVPVLILGLSLSRINELPASFAAAGGLQLEGNSMLYLLLKYLVFGRLLPAPESYGGLPALLYWVRYFFTGRPLPLGGVDVLLHPVAMAGWAGLLVTALNLIPAGQLDGGHLMYVLLGRRTKSILPFILIGLALLGVFWSGWWLWAVLIFLMGRFHAEPLDQITPLDPPRKWLAVLGIVIFILVFTPVPLLFIGA